MVWRHCSGAVKYKSKSHCFKVNLFFFLLSLSLSQFFFLSFMVSSESVSKWFSERIWIKKTLTGTFWGFVHSGFYLIPAVGFFGLDKTLRLSTRFFLFFSSDINLCLQSGSNMFGLWNHYSVSDLRHWQYWLYSPSLCRIWSEPPKTGFLASQLWNPIDRHVEIYMHCVYVSNTWKCLATSMYSPNE